jgi:chromosome transmission fidelity protein 4
MMINIARDALADELTTDEISQRELALDKELIQLIQSACKNDRLSRAIDLVKLLHHTASFDIAVRVAQFYHLPGLQEKIEALKEDREEDDRLVSARDKRRSWAADVAPIPDAKMPSERSKGNGQKTKAFQDFGPPPSIHRPGLAKATPAIDAVRELQTTTQREPEPENIRSDASPDGKRKRAGEEYPGIQNSEPKRRAIEPAGPPKRS